MKYINIDFETRSTTDLKKSGVYRYVEDPNTDVWCMAYAKGDLEPQIWIPPNPLPPEIIYWLEEGCALRAWNAQFERIIWNTICQKYEFPQLPNDRFYCTAADALAMGLPGWLDGAVKALRLKIEKDMAGNRLALQMCKPRKTKDDSLRWWDVPDKLEHLYEYCKQDVRAEVAAMGATRRLSDEERAVYLLDQTINDRGVYLDQPLAKRCRSVALEGIKRANKVVVETTNGDVSRITQVGKMQYWLREQGCDIPNLKKNTLQEYLGQDLPEPIKDVLLARAEAGKASVAKIDAMFACVCSDSRLRGLLQYHGAGTGRWAGRLVQPQNLFRPTVEDIEHYIPRISTSHMPIDYDALDLEENPVGVVASLLRYLLTASPEHRLVCADFKAIEARIIAWLAGQDDLVEMFAAHDRGEGEEVYVITAEQFNTTRYIGKHVILGAGFGMGGDKFYKQGKEQYGIDFDEIDPPTGVRIKQEWAVEDADQEVWALYHREGRWELPDYGHAVSHAFIKLWRARYPLIPQYWYACQNLMLSAVRNPGSVQELGPIKASFRGRHLWLILPSKRPLCYLFPSIVERDTPWGEKREAVRVWTRDSVTHRWRPQVLYGGLIAENITQATARDVMVYAMNTVTEEGYPIILTVHDEIVADAPNGFGSFEHYIKLMQRKPSWANGLPVEVSGWEGQRYRKD